MRREIGMAAAARAARGAIGGHSPALRVVRHSRSKSTQLQRLQDRSAAAPELRRGRVRWKKKEGGRRAQRITSPGVRRACGIARRQLSNGASAACGGEERESRRETGMAAATRAARGAIGGHSPALRIVWQSCSRSTQLKRLQDRSAAALELRRGRVRWKKEEGGIKNSVAVASSNLNVVLDDSTIRQMALRAPPGGVKGFANRAARAAHAGPRATVHTLVSPAVLFLPRKAALRSGAEISSMMTAHVSCGRVSQAFLAILEPERQGWADSGVSQVARGQGHQTKGWILDGRNKP
jgi:hypothetical protein